MPWEEALEGQGEARSRCVCPFGSLLAASSCAMTFPAKPHE